jgi:hypothetical protein
MSADYLDRTKHPTMEYYRHVYKDSRMWTGTESVEGKTVIVYCEQGLGDNIQFARYVPLLKEKCTKVILHCPTELHRLFAHFGVDMIDKDNAELPEHDCHVLSMSLPFSLHQFEVSPNYLVVPEQEDLSEFDGFYKIGIAWEGGPTHPNNAERNCPLKHFKALQTDKTKLLMLQKEIHMPQLVEGAEDMNLNGVQLNDFYDTAKLINSLDLVVTVDTAVLHLAGALGKPVMGLLSKRVDTRWAVPFHWYANLCLFRQKSTGDWDSVFEELLTYLRKQEVL